MLTIEQLEEIKALQQVVERYDSIELKLNWDMLENRSEEEQTDFLTYDSGQLVGFLGLYSFGSKIEVCGMVHPDYRRKGIFSNLFQNSHFALEKARHILLNVPANSKLGKQWLDSITCIYEESEYMMKWEGKVLPDQDESISLRPSRKEDIDMKMKLDIVCFDFKAEESKMYNDRLEKEGLQKEFFMIEADDKIVGKIRIHRDKERSEIYGFAVLPEFQGKGYGRKALQEAVRLEAQRGQSVYLDVQTENEKALSLYTSTGFIKESQQDYYLFSI
ncbi:GNAT family N-acetyltransferase [Terribacillus saccharophilus]|uniref:GNAT family N-acetyltransferase n=1 Tax=Terribacillus saccharophilus TaxID=361277 RepID=UPI002989BC42|nr:GNAT family N-acetyltransferase [Terribacillus saccharophilus]MCM3227283.1 GNAT family N-acetyltransferase [Terribacillus saccharophilus]MEC0283941.1 GNAT family N-acetyltransferase [Terribacillus saccharophilus]MEC0289834.1 GNAT family N-acetyltransferase [Terribacillus saccharophilus]